MRDMRTTVCSRVGAFPPPYVLDKQEKQIAEDYAVVYCQHIELFSYFLADTAMHPVLKNLGITDKVISFIVESVNSKKVKTNLLWYRNNRCVLNKCLLKPNKINTVSHKCMNMCSYLCALMCSCEYMSCQGMWRKSTEACMIERWNGLY